MRICILLMLLNVCFCSCKKENTDNQFIVGKWKWEKTVPVVAPERIAISTIYPAAGEIYVLNLKKDNTYTYTLNDSLLNSGTYHLSKDSTQSNWKLFYSNQTSLYDVLINKDTLLLVSSIAGSGYSEYLRIQQ